MSSPRFWIRFAGRLFLGVVFLCGCVLGLAADIAYRDGRLVKNVRIMDRGPNRVIAFESRLGVFTVEASQITAACAAQLGIHEETPEEVSARLEQEERAKAAAEEARAAEQKAKDAAAVAAAAANAARSGSPAPARMLPPSSLPPPISADDSGVVSHGPAYLLPSGVIVRSDAGGAITTMARIQGRVIERYNNGALVYAEGAPSRRSSSFDQYHSNWVSGTVFIFADSHLNSTYKDAPVSGELYPAGSIRLPDGRTVPAWSFSPR